MKGSAAPSMPLFAAVCPMCARGFERDSPRAADSLAPSRLRRRGPFVFEFNKVASHDPFSIGLRDRVNHFGDWRTLFEPGGITKQHSLGISCRAEFLGLQPAREHVPS